MTLWNRIFGSSALEGMAACAKCGRKILRATDLCRSCEEAVKLANARKAAAQKRARQRQEQATRVAQARAAEDARRVQEVASRAVITEHTYKAHLASPHVKRVLDLTHSCLPTGRIHAPRYPRPARKPDDFYEKKSTKALKSMKTSAKSELRKQERRLADLRLAFPVDLREEEARHLKRAAEARREIVALQDGARGRLPRRGLLEMVVHGYDDRQPELSPLELQLVGLLESQIAESSFWRTALSLAQGEVSHAEKRIAFLTKKLNQIEKAQKPREEEAAKARRKQDHLKARVAAAEERTRKAAEAVKRQLRVLPVCPYCGGAMANPRADHIWPVARGGLSATENMVYVCEACNAAKSDLTLREFIRKQGLDRDSIENRLESLGKRF